jgi:hypothetical protein
MLVRRACVLIAFPLLVAGAAQAQRPPSPERLSPPGQPQAQRFSPSSGFRESFRLEVPASFVAGRPTQVWCARNASVWHAANRAAGGNGYAFTDAAASFYPAGTCATLEGWRVNSQVTSLFGLDLLVLVHESLHAGGVADERAAQCRAKRELAEVAIRFFGFEPRTAKIRKLVRLAYVRASGIPSAC